jgi:hypothetical protein
VKTVVELRLTAHSAPEVLPPVWDAEVTFVQGVPAVVDLTTYARDPQGLPMQFREVEAMDAALEGAFHWNRDTFLLSYDGRDLGLKEGDAPLLLNSKIRIEASN